MGIEARHSYRFGYLKSEHWQCLRTKKLAEEDAKCLFCGVRDLSNDVHHIHYPDDLFSVTTKTLRVLCRAHHEEIHRLTDELKIKYPGSEKGHDFKRFRLASVVIEEAMRKSGLTPTTRQGAKKPAPKPKPIETDKCPHTIRTNEMIRLYKERREFLWAIRTGVRRLKKMKNNLDLWIGLPPEFMAEIDKAEASMAALAQALTELQKNNR